MMFINGTNLNFTRISSEIRRTYVFPCGAKVTIEKPTYLHVSENGHRIYDEAGISHYIPKTWVHLYWEAKPDHPSFVA
jgi:hypothetical protein